VGRVIAIHQGPDGRHRPGPPARDDRFTPVIEWVLNSGQLGQPYLVPLRYTSNHDEAEDVKRSLYNAARYFCGCGERHCVRKHSNIQGCPDQGQRVSCQAKIVRKDGHVRVQFTFFDKKEAMREVIAKYGPDPSKWPYQSKAKKLKEG
jgi:hypothetical protein